MATREDYLPYKLAPGVDYSWSHTDTKDTRFCHLWTIKKFSSLQEATKEYIQSPTFSSREDDGNKWFLQLFPRGETEEYKDKVSLYLHKPVGDFAVDVDYGFAIINAKGQISHNNLPTGKPEDRRTFKKGGSWGYKDFIDRDRLMNEENNFLRNDELTILCEVDVAGKVNTSGTFTLTYTQDSKRDVAEDLGQLFEGRKFCDVILVAEDGEVHAHKAILSLRSPVLAAMFEHDMEEKQKNRIEITDIDHGVLQELVRFIYTRRAPTMDDKMATELLAAADKYDVEELKMICEESLSKNLTCEKVIDLIPVVSLYNASHLKSHVIQFIKSRSVVDVVDRLWDILISDHPKQAVETFRSNTALKEAEP